MPLHYQDAILQTAYTEISANTTTSATGTPAPLMNLTMTTGANPVIVYFSASCGNSASNAWTEFRLVLDGSPVRGIAVFSVSSGNGNSGTLVYKTSVLPPGLHTFAIEWRVGSGSGTAYIYASSQGNASLYLEEVTV